MNGSASINASARAKVVSNDISSFPHIQFDVFRAQVCRVNRVFRRPKLEINRNRKFFLRNHLAKFRNGRLAGNSIFHRYNPVVVNIHHLFTDAGSE